MFNSLNPGNENAPEINNIKFRKRLNSFVTNLWELWENYFLKNGWYHYASFLMNNEEFKKRAAIINYHYNKLFNKCDNCGHTSIKIPSENRASPSSHLENFNESLRLSRATLTGCEGFVYASEILNNENVFERVYSHWRAPGISRLQLLWLPFIKCAGEFKRKDILIDILQIMKIHYREIDTTNAIVFLYSAHKTGVKEILEYFEGLNAPSQWDLLTPYNPFLDNLISAYAIGDDSSLSEKLEKRSFEGEFWTKYFKNFFNGNNVESANICNGYKRLLQFNKKNVSEWYTSLSFAQETYVRELRSRIYDEFIKKFSHYDHLGDDNFLAEISSGNVSEQIKKYQNKISELIVHKPIEYLRDEVFEGKFLPLIDYLLSIHMSFLTNRESFYKWQNDNGAKAVIFENALKLFKNIDSEFVTDKEWQYFILLSSSRIHNNVASNLSKIFLAEFHSIKRIFVEKYEKIFQNEKVPISQKYSLLADARAYIKNISLKLPKYRITGPQSIDIIAEIEQHLLSDSLDYNGNVSRFTSAVYIAGYDGICEDYLRPMFLEIRSNAKKALYEINKRNQRRYEINLDHGKEDYSNYLILSVTNNFQIKNGGSQVDPVSTGIGLKNIQHYATFFQKDDLQGWAQFKTAYKKKYGYFTVQIYFPLWES